MNPGSGTLSSSPVPARDGFDADADVVVVGAGLAGLTAAAFAARAGARVVLLERSSEPGGRAATHSAGGFRFNLGPHALYDGGAASKAFAELGVAFTGRRPPTSGGLALRRGRLHALPGGFVSLLSTDLLSLGGKLELARVLAGLARIDASTLRGRTVREWLDAGFHDPVARDLIEALLRLTGYTNDPGRACAAASLAQLQAGLGSGVIYVDEGWSTLVEGLRDSAAKAGVDLRTNWRVRRVHSSDGLVEVEDAQGRRLRARTAVLALPPPVAASVVEGEGQDAVQARGRAARPVKAACLDLGLRRLPVPSRLFVVGLDQPLYFSVHSASARLAPAGAATLHVAKYLGADDGDAKDVEAELEAFCDLVQPGWRGQVAERRYLPSMTVAGDLVEAARPRAGVEVPGAPGLLLAGDWVSAAKAGEPEAMLADAAVASGREAGRIAARRARERSERGSERAVA